MGRGWKNSLLNELESIYDLQTEKGVMKVEFYEKDAPKTVENFIKLAESGFYDGLISVQDIAAQYCTVLLDPKPNDIILDEFFSSRTKSALSIYIRSK